MKKLTVSMLSLVLFLQIGKAQLPVIDEAHIQVNSTSWVVQLMHAANQVSSLVESASHLNESINFYKKVSGAIKNAQMLSNVFETQVGLITYASEAMTMPPDKIGSQKCYLLYRKKILVIIEKNTTNTQVIKDFVTQGIFNMNDAQRLAAVERMEQKTNELYHEIYNAKFAFENTNSRLLAIKALKN